jgi:flagellar basal body-associated protein FliL
MRRFLRVGILTLAGITGAVPHLLPPMAAPMEARAEEPAPAKPQYLQLGDFTINLPIKNDQLSYAVISITVEANQGGLSDLKAIEPRLKELVMRRLMAMADRGVLQPNHTDVIAVKDALMTSLSELQPKNVKDVLIVRLLYG